MARGRKPTGQEHLVQLSLKARKETIAAIEGIAASDRRSRSLVAAALLERGLKVFLEDGQLFVSDGHHKLLGGSGGSGRQKTVVGGR